MNDSLKNKLPFVIQLIDELKKHEFISSGIMLPLLIGAYKVKEDYDGRDHLEFTKHVYWDVIESLYMCGQHLFFRECEASHNFIIEPVNERPKKCNATILYKETAVIYCDDATLGDGCKKDANEMQSYFLNKLLKQTVKYCNYIDTDANTAEYKEWMCRLNDDETIISEKTIIKSLIQQ